MEKASRKAKAKQVKTEGQMTPIELGKPIVRLPNIAKKTGMTKFRYEKSLDRSLDCKDKLVYVRPQFAKEEVPYLNAEQSLTRKYSNNSQNQLLTFDEMELCVEKSKKMLPKINGMGSYSRQNTERSINQEFHRRLNRIKSQKKIESNLNELCSYRMGPIIGRGNYSVVKICETNDGTKFAAKIYPKIKINTPQKQLNLREEVAIIRSIKHPNIIEFNEYIETEENHYIIMELFDNISLAQFIKKQAGPKRQSSYDENQQEFGCKSQQKPCLPQNIARKIFIRILRAFQYLHENGIAHRDVKLENFLVRQDEKDLQVKVIDYGFSCRCLKDRQPSGKTLDTRRRDEETFFDYCGTPPYMSPEIIQKKGYLARLADVWALGVLLFVMATGHFPFKAITEKSDFSNSICSEVNQNIKLNPSLQSCLKKMLRNDASARPSVKEILRQPWLQTKQ